jgi:hypothetical protein
MKLWRHERESNSRTGSGQCLDLIWCLHNVGRAFKFYHGWNKNLGNVYIYVVVQYFFGCNFKWDMDTLNYRVSNPSAMLECIYSTQENRIKSAPWCVSQRCRKTLGEVEEPFHILFASSSITHRKKYLGPLASPRLTEHQQSKEKLQDLPLLFFFPSLSLSKLRREL